MMGPILNTKMALQICLDFQDPIVLLYTGIPDLLLMAPRRFTKTGVITPAAAPLVLSFANYILMYPLLVQVQRLLNPQSVHQEL